MTIRLTIHLKESGHHRLVTCWTLKERRKEFKKEGRVEGLDKKRPPATPITVRNTKVGKIVSVL